MRRIDFDRRGRDEGPPVGSITDNISVR
jgi:hypothetical protein